MVVRLADNNLLWVMKSSSKGACFIDSDTGGGLMLLRTYKEMFRYTPTIEAGIASLGNLMTIIALEPFNSQSRQNCAKLSKLCTFLCCDSRLSMVYTCSLITIYSSAPSDPPLLALVLGCLHLKALI